MMRSRRSWCASSSSRKVSKMGINGEVCVGLSMMLVLASESEARRGRFRVDMGIWNGMVEDGMEEISK